MKVMTVISSNYQNAFEYEIKRFSFAIQLFPDIRSATKDLVRMNIEENLGFIYLDNNLKDIDDLLDFLELLDLYCGSERRLLLCIKEKESIKNLRQALAHKLFKVKISLIDGFDFVSDDLINKCFYDVLRDTQEPYIDKSINDEEGSIKRINTLRYDSLFNQRIEQIVAPFYKVRNDPDATCELDSFCNAYRFKSSELYKMREAYIHSFFGSEKDLTTVIEKFRESKDFLTVCCIANSIQKTCDKVKLINERRFSNGK